MTAMDEEKGCDLDDSLEGAAASLFGTGYTLCLAENKPNAGGG